MFARQAVMLRNLARQPDKCRHGAGYLQSLFFGVRVRLFGTAIGPFAGTKRTVRQNNGGRWKSLTNRARQPLQLGGVGRFAVQQNKKLLRGSEEHTSELQSLMRISYAVFCLKKKIK